MTRVARPFVMALAAVLLVGTAVDVRAAVLCRKRSGRVVLAEKCGKRQTALAPADLGLTGPPGPDGTDGAPGDPGVLPYRVVDALGSTVGVLQGQIGFRNQVVLVPPLTPIPIQIEVIDGAIAPGEFPDIVRYAAADCTGTAFVRDGGTPLPFAHLIGDTLYFATALPTSTSFGSVETEDDPCTGTPTARGTCCKVQATTVPGSPATAIPFATLGITQPLTVEPRP